ncbi:hypothetical protein RJ640_017999 [Escallonia rubra]|uniref:WPP domain-associated protein n=1 Tax=Escallonia rubra TaxID=112253 RepID=A0AA88RS85_9ASTE|nr:hypothetical protein RJ640_017999 [Escallonia rubra]
MESVRVSDNGDNLSRDLLGQVGTDENGSENLGDNLVEEMDSYWNDINDRFMISRMVSDSVIKGMINAVEEEAAEKIAAKELEITKLKESLYFLHVGSNNIDVKNEPESSKSERSMSFSCGCVEHDKMRESLRSLRTVSIEQFLRLRKEIDGIRGSSAIRRIGSGSELIGLGGILKEDKSWVGVDRTVDRLKMIMDVMCKKVDDILLSKTSLCEWQQEQEFQRELEAMVMQSVLRSIEEELKERLCGQNAHCCDGQGVKWVEKFNEILSLHKQLDAILKLLPNPEAGQLVSHGSGDLDHSHRKTLSNHTSFSTSLWEGNGKVDKSKTDDDGNGKVDKSKTGDAEHFDALQLNHMSNKELVNLFNNTIAKTKRDHECTVQKITEDYYKLKAEYLKEKGSSLPHRKEKEFEVLRKKIPEVISKLDDILVDNEKFPDFSNSGESPSSLKDRLDGLVSENRQLRDSLTDKENKVRCLSSQVSDAAENILQSSLAEAHLQNLIGNLNAAVEDARMEVSVTEDVFKCVLRELSSQIKCNNDESQMELSMMQGIYEIVFREVALGAEITGKCEIENSDLEKTVMQGLSEVIFRETIKDTEQELKRLYGLYSVAKDNEVSLRKKILKLENGLISEVKEKEKFRQEVDLLKMSVQEKETLAMQASAALTKEREQLELSSQELNTLRCDASERSMELESVKSELVKAMQKIEVDRLELSSLNQKLEQAMKELKEAEKQRQLVVALTQERQNDLLSFKAKEEEVRKQMDAIIVFVNWLLKSFANFECRIADNINANNSRLEHSRSQLSSLMKKANTLRRTGLSYKQRLERRYCDLQLAESEVDLLGDEVDYLLSLLEKIYIALDHYSSILQHYPGVR